MKNLIIFVLLPLAFSCGKHELVKALGDGNQKAKVSNELNSDPLIIATTTGNYTDVKQYLADGQDPNSIDERGRSLLMIATLNNNYVIVDLLLKNGADINWTNIDGETVLDLEADDLMTKILTDNTSITESDWQDYLLKLIKEASQDTQNDVINEMTLLFEFGVSPNTADSRASVLMYACNKKLGGIVQFLVDQPGLDINLLLGKGSRQYTALDMTRDPEIKNILIAKGALSFKEL